MEDDLQWKKTSNGRQPPMEVEYPSNHCMYHEFLGGKLEESSEEISSVALLSPACLLELLKAYEFKV